jgi:hypothetical protein
VPDDAALRKHLIDLLEGGQAHITMEDAVKGFPVHRAGERPGGSPHSAWELLEHIRIAQEDIVAFSGGTARRMPTGKNPPEGYRELKWPDGYWPASPAPANQSEWDNSVAAIRKDLRRFLRLVEDPQRNLFVPFPWGTGQTLLREALLIADHNAYHLGQLMLVRRLLEGGGKPG